MFFTVSKVASLFLLPFPFFYLCGLIGLLSYRSRIKTGKRSVWPLFMYLIFGFISTDYFANQIFRTLEDRLPRLSTESVPEADAAFVLGAISNPLASVDDVPQFTDGVDRLLTAMDLFRAGKVRYIILTGKSSLIDHRGRAESEDLKRFLVQQGFPADRILTDTESRNTAENFQFGLRIAQEHNLKRHLLITSAFHMYRGLHTFQRVQGDHFPEAGFEMIPFPVDYRSDRIPAGVEAFVPSAHAVYKSSLAIKEYMGLVAYVMQGYIDPLSLYRDLFPDAWQP